MTVNNELGFQPVIIIGAGRSGTNILRDTLCSFSEFGTWDCDEINPIWRHGNIAAEHDEFSPEMASPKIRQFIRKQFREQWTRQKKSKFVVEKTCANSLRVDFVDTVIPEAKYLFLVRNGLDVVASAQKRWKGEMELASLPYYWSKIKHTPLRDLPIYGWRFAKARMGMLLGAAEHMSFWGPQFSGLADTEKDSSLNTLCALQWNACIERSLNGFAKMDDDRFLTIHYESLTQNSETEMAKILEFLNHPTSKEEISAAVAPISASAIGKGKLALKDEAHELQKLMEPWLLRLGYEVGTD